MQRGRPRLLNAVAMDSRLCLYSLLGLLRLRTRLVFGDGVPIRYGVWNASDGSAKAILG